MTYCLDFCIRALSLLDNGRCVAEVSRLLNIGRSTLDAWVRRSRSGQLKACYPHSRRGYKVDARQLEAYVLAHPDAYQHEIAVALGVKPTTICEALKRLG